MWPCPGGSSAARRTTALRRAWTSPARCRRTRRPGRLSASHGPTSAEQLERRIPRRANPLDRQRSTWHLKSEASKPHSGLPSRLALRSHRSLTGPPTAVCMTPSSGRATEVASRARDHATRRPCPREYPRRHARRGGRQATRGGDRHVVAPSDGEDEAVTFVATSRIRTHTQVRRAVVRIGTRLVGAVERERGRESEVCRF